MEEPNRITSGSLSKTLSRQQRGCGAYLIPYRQFFIFHINHMNSLFPTSIGANPQLSIYGLVNRLTQDLIGRLGGKAEVLA